MKRLFFLILLFPSLCFGTVLFNSNFNSWSNWTQTQSTSISYSCYTGCSLTDSWTAWNVAQSQCPAGVTSDPGNNSLYVNTIPGYPTEETGTCRGGSGKCLTKWMEACDSGDTFDDSDANMGVDLGSEYADVYFRFYIKFPTDFNLGGTDTSFKLVHVQHYNGGGANPWNYFERDTNNQPCSSGGIRRCNSVDCAGSGNDYIDFYLEARGYSTYYTHGFIFWRISTYTVAKAAGGILDGDWHSITLHYHRNSTVGATDGYIDLWVDGNAKTEFSGYEATGIDWTDSGGDLRGWRFLSVGGNNMKWTTACSDGTGDMVSDGCEQWYVIDDVKIATTLDEALADDEEGDETAPSVTADDSTKSITVDSYNAEGDATDAVGVSGCKWRLASAPDANNGTACSGTTAWTCNTSGYSSGSNTLHVGCYDAAGNFGTDTVTVTYTPPTTTHTGQVMTGVSIR
jgi:hypothetical protein